MTRTSARAALPAVAAVGLASATAGAYVIGAPSVFRRFAEKQAFDPPAPVTLVGRAFLADPGAGGTETEVPIRMDLAGPSGCRAQLELPGGTATASMEKGKFAGGSNPALDAAVALGCPLASLRGQPAVDVEARLAKTAAGMGIDATLVSLSRLGRRPAWIVGARPQDPERPQLWFDKESSRPVRVVGKVAGRLWDVRFLDPASLATRGTHPRIVEVWQGRDRLLAIHLMTTGAEGAAAPRALDETGADDAE